MPTKARVAREAARRAADTKAAVAKSRPLKARRPQPRPFAEVVANAVERGVEAALFRTSSAAAPSPVFTGGNVMATPPTPIQPSSSLLEDECKNFEGCQEFTAELVQDLVRRLSPVLREDGTKNGEATAGHPVRCRSALAGWIDAKNDRQANVNAQLMNLLQRLDLP